VIGVPFAWSFAGLVLSLFALFAVGVEILFSPRTIWVLIPSAALNRKERTTEMWAVACSSAGMQVATAGVARCDRGDKNIRSGERQQL
jgi:hypothetical protein